ncbi:MAG: hypothetical protein GQ523_11125 [Methanophagales archaeon]|nr:hypothetical protein [Methanophagales archaeon]
MAGLIHMLPYLDESTQPSDYLPTKRAQCKVFHNDGVDTVTIDQNVKYGQVYEPGCFCGFQVQQKIIPSRERL